MAEGFVKIFPAALRIASRVRAILGLSRAGMITVFC